MLVRFWCFFVVGTTGQVCFVCCNANNSLLRKCLLCPLVFAVFNKLLYRFGRSPALLRFFLPVLLQNECCNIFLLFFILCFAPYGHIVLRNYLFILLLSFLFFDILCTNACLPYFLVSFCSSLHFFF